MLDFYAHILLHHLQSYIGAIKQLKKPSKNVIAVMKCCFYCCGSTPRQVREWMQIRMALKPALFLEKISTFEPISPGNKRKRLCLRVRRVLRSVYSSSTEGTFSSLPSCKGGCEDHLGCTHHFLPLSLTHIHIRAAFSGVIDEDLRAESVAVFLLYQWYGPPLSSMRGWWMCGSPWSTAIDTIGG